MWASQLMDTYRQVPDRTRLSWSFSGIKHAIKYGPIPFTTTEPVLQVFELLEQTVASETKERLDKLLSTPTPSTSVATRP